MMGTTKLGIIREQIAAAYAKAGMNPIETLESEISKLEESPAEHDGEIRALLILRDAFVKSQKKPKPRRSRRLAAAK